jgi:hypothetical protein
MRIIVVAPAFPPGQIIDPSTLSRESEQRTGDDAAAGLLLACLFSPLGNVAAAEVRRVGTAATKK